MTNLTKRSLQINIGSVSDARSVAQNIGSIKKSWDKAKAEKGVESVEFQIAEPIRAEVDPILAGIVSWTRRYDTIIKVHPNNVYHPLPPYREVVVRQVVQVRHPTRRAALQKALEASGSPLVTSATGGRVVRKKVPLDSPEAQAQGEVPKALPVGEKAAA